MDKGNPTESPRTKLEVGVVLHIPENEDECE